MRLRSDATHREIQRSAIDAWGLTCSKCGLTLKEIRGTAVAAPITAMDRQQPLQLERLVESLHHLCESLPECDAVGKLRGKLGRLRSAMDEYNRDGDAGALRQELSAAHAIVERFHDADPLNRMLQTVSELRRTIDNQAPR